MAETDKEMKFHSTDWIAQWLAAIADMQTSHWRLGASLWCIQYMEKPDTAIAHRATYRDSVEKLLARIDGYKVGDTIQLTVLRKGEEIVVPVTLQPGE